MITKNLLTQLTEINYYLKDVRKTIILTEKEQQKILEKVLELEKQVKELDPDLLIECEKYQNPSLRNLTRRVEDNKITIEDYEYLIKTIKYLKNVVEKDKKNRKYSTFKTLSRKEKLRLAYNEYALSKLIDCKFMLINKTGKIGENFYKYKTEIIQQRLRKERKIIEKVDNKEKITREEMIDYVFSLDGYEKEEIDQNIKKQSLKTIKNLSWLKKQFPTATFINKKLKIQKKYYFFAMTIKKNNRLEAITYLITIIKNKLIQQELSIASSLENNQDFESVINEEEIKFLKTCISYLDETKKKSDEEELISKELLYPLQQLESLNEEIKIVENLSAGIKNKDAQSIIDMSNLIENYIIATEILSDNKSCHKSRVPVLEYMKNQCQIIESWCQPIMQEIKEDKVIVPQNRHYKSKKNKTKL